MASWEQLRDFIRTNHRISEELPEGVSMAFDTGGGRTQLVFVTHYTLRGGSEDWVVIESPFAESESVDVGLAVRATAKMVCGGVGLYQSRYLTIRHAVPLENLDVNEFERPLLLVTNSADILEARLTGRDEL